MKKFLLLFLLTALSFFTLNVHSSDAAASPVTMNPLSLTHQPNDLTGGTVVLRWDGTARVADILDLSNMSYTVHFTIPEELRYLMDDPAAFKNNISASYQYPFINLLGIITGYGTQTVSGDDMQIDAGTGDISFTVSYAYVSLLNLIGTLNVSHSLTIHLDQMGVTKLPPNPDKELTFTGTLLDQTSSVSLPTWYRQLGIHLLDPAADSTNVLTLPVGNNGEPFNPLGQVKVIDEETGDAVPDATVTVTADDVNSGGHLWLAGDYPLTYQATDSYGIRAARTVTVRIVPGGLSFVSVPGQLTFATAVISSEPQWIARANPSDWVIEIEDLRGEAEGRWSIWVSAARLMNASGDSLQAGTLSVYGGAGDASQMTAQLGDGQSHEVVSGTTYPSDQGYKTIAWDKDSGPLLHVSPGDAYAGTYHSLLTWTLIDAP
ncbi:WxL domain-containing protein [Sporolactobacillus sp. CQH2019]|uniref:WxL domain-containing protein n=1 Tax=Sporolactobacillus sp. CQH2019 TaxID=3023512 RepID=UPI002368AB39|nr:WxL domain-containing protein [Sporolactobacillus sp. CQH2019]MDD9150655.1 WxL domain-containing protein [Sporolactobacillus sp. CQH2019]